MDELLFDGTKGGIPLRVGKHHHDVQFGELDALKPFDPEDSFGRDTMATYDTGQGTDHDESVIRTRPQFRFEGIYDRPRARFHPTRMEPVRQLGSRLAEDIKVWLGLTPFERNLKPPGVYFGLREAEGTYRAPRSVSTEQV